jgi:hypothetical protein
MPRNTSKASGPAGGVHVAGRYSAVLHGCREQHNRIDERLTFTRDLTEAQWQMLRAERETAEPSPRYAALLANQPVCIGHSKAAEWITPDDYVSPADPADVMPDNRSFALGADAEQHRRLNAGEPLSPEYEQWWSDFRAAGSGKT